MIPASRWRAILARLPLPMLALAASYGVYSFNRLFVPTWVALISAAAFELTYVGLALLRADDAAQRRRARAISLGAVAVSVTYNTLAGLAHRAPEAFAVLPREAEVVLALLHGAPLAIVAFLVADLLLHEDARTPVQRVAPDAPAHAHSVADVARMHADDAQRVAPDARMRADDAQAVAPDAPVHAQRVAPDAHAHAHNVADVARMRADSAHAHAQRVAPVAPDARDLRASALAALQAGASVAEVARRYGVNPSTLRSWRARATTRVPAAD